jgi:AAA+ ATPase superfamily predicted ATPase
VFVGREKELKSLNEMFDSDRFEFFVLYGQRRIGKTTLISEFIKEKEAIFMTAKEVNDQLNLEEFTRKIEAFFRYREDTLHFHTWEYAFIFIAEQSKNQEILVIIDEYPYAAIANGSLNSMLQVAIDHHLKNSKVKLLISGSHVSFMEEKVMGAKSPIYGRRTGLIQLKPFDYHDAAKMLETFSIEDRIRFYGVLDGIPYYLSLVNKKESFQENVKRLFFGVNGTLFNEPEMIIRQEFDSPARYNSIIEAVARGAKTPSQIEQVTGIEKNPASVYIKTLIDIGFLSKIVPFGENPLKSRKGNYFLGNNMFQFWFQYVSPNFSDIQLGNGNIVFDRRVSHLIEDYTGKYVFEKVCMQYLLRCNERDMLPFLASKVGKWWGNDPVNKKQTDVDVIVSDPEYSKSIILGECKWRTDIKEIQEIEKLIRKSYLFKSYEHFYYYFLLKGEFSEDTRAYFSPRSDVILLGLEQLFTTNISNFSKNNIISRISQKMT